MKYVYSLYLYSEKYNKHYVGYTSDLESRLLSHNFLATKGYTIKFRPWKIIYSKIFDSKKEAMAYELWLKSGIGRSFIKTLSH